MLLKDECVTFVLSKAKAWTKTADCNFCADFEGNSAEFCRMDLNKHYNHADKKH